MSPRIGRTGGSAARAFGKGLGGSRFIVATGGTVTTSGNYKIHTFLSSGTFTVSALGVSPLVDYLVVAGGGSGGGSNPGNYWAGGGGGAGGLLTAAAYTVSAIAYTITVGPGGTTPAASGTGNQGSNSSFAAVAIAVGGGYGGYGSYPGQGGNGGNGGSGGGTGQGYSGTPTAGTGTRGQGNDGGTTPGGAPSYIRASGGGAGSAARGETPRSGLSNSISGTAVTYATGGPCCSLGSGTYGDPSALAVPSTPNTGDGGPGAGTGVGTNLGLAGGSGIVIIRYLYQ